MLTGLLDKVRIRKIRDRGELQSVAIQTAAKQLQIEKLTAEKNDAVIRAEAPYELTIEDLQGEVKTNVHQMKAWSVENREEFRGKQSLTVAGQCLKFRKNSGSVSMAEGVKEADALDQVLASDDVELIKRVVKVKPSFDKAAIKKLYESGKEGRETLRKYGIEVKTSETFAFEPNTDEVPEEALKA